MQTPAHPDAKKKLLNASQNVFRFKGYAATTVDDIRNIGTSAWSGALRAYLNGGRFAAHRTRQQLISSSR